MTRCAPIPETVTVHVPFCIVKRGGRKEMQLPDGAVQPRRTDSTLIKVSIPDQDGAISRFDAGP